MDKEEDFLFSFVLSLERVKILNAWIKNKIGKEGLGSKTFLIGYGRQRGRRGG